MAWHLLRFNLGLLLLGIVLLSALGQDADAPRKDKAPPAANKTADDTEDYRQYFHKPTNTTEFWDAMQFEIDVGRFDLAAAHLRGLLAGSPSDDELVQMADKQGVGAFLKLRNVARWSTDPKVEKEARQNVDKLIKRVTDAVRKVRSDPRRIEGHIKNLMASPEENAYAVGQLYQSGPAAVPQLIDAIRAATGDERLTLLRALARLHADTIPAVAAALDSGDPVLQLDIIRLLRRRGAIEATPYLWYLSAAPTANEQVRREALQALAAFLEKPASRLPSARAALTQEAERYYQHLVSFPDPKAVVVWRWNGQHVVQGWDRAPTVSADQAELYYGLYFAKQALALDPSYVPAQVVMLSLTLEKAMEQAQKTRDKPADRGAPAAAAEGRLLRLDPSVQAVLSTVDPNLVITVLDRALREQRPAVILAALADLGDRAEKQAGKPDGYGQPPVVRALYYPDRRVQMAAAETLLRLPDSASSQATARAVEVFRRAVAAASLGRPRPKVLVGYPTEDLAYQVAGVVSDSGYEPVRVTTGRDVMRRLQQASDIELLLLDEALPLPQLPWLLGQLRADATAKQLPIILSAGPLRYEAVRRYVERWPNMTVVPTAVVLRVNSLRPLLGDHLADSSTTLTAAELKSYTDRAMRHLADLAQGTPPGYDVLPAGDTVREALRFPSPLTPERQISAITVVGHLPGAGPQRELANVVLETKRPAAVRVAASKELVRHIQRNGILLSATHVGNLQAMLPQLRTDDPLRDSLAVVLGTLQPGARTTGERLLQYYPPVPAAPEAPSEPKK